MEYKIVSERSSKVVADGETLMVSFDTKKNVKTSVPEKVRQAIVELDGPSES